VHFVARTLDPVEHHLLSTLFTGAPARQADVVAEATIAFVDLAGFVALTEAHGARTAADLAVRFSALARQAAAPPARIVKTIGDAVMICAPEAAAGLTATASLIQACLREPDFPLARGGIDHGTVEERDGDYFGPAVNLAARLTSHTAGPRLLLTEQVAAAATSVGYHIEPVGPLTLRNVSRPVTAYAIRLDDRTQTVIDPVCRMQLDPATAPARLHHNGRDHWFCSRDCIAAFAAHPEAYTTHNTQ
jgi:adenylate cyclase